MADRPSTVAVPLGRPKCTPDIKAISTRSKAHTGPVSTRSKLCRGVDGRSATARRFRDLAADFAADLGGTLTTAEIALVRQAALVTLRSEAMLADTLNGATVATDDMVRATNATVRVMAALGALHHKRQPARKTLAQHLEERDKRTGATS
jgi:hypothetical protein